MRNGRFAFTHDESASLGALSRIASDLASRKVVLGDLWDIEGKTRYLDKLEAEGVLPNCDHTVAQNESPPLTPRAPKIKPTASPSPSTRSTLIPQKTFDLPWPGRIQRLHNIWEELQFHLELKQHSNAVSVLFRVLIELSMENYIKQAGVVVHNNDKLAVRLEKSGLHLLSLKKIDNKQMDVLRKFKHGEQLISADTLNKYVHSSNFAPSPEHLKSMWDSLANVIVLFLKA